MNARKYFINEYIIPNGVVGITDSNINFTEPFISLDDLINDLQSKVNEAACTILNAPDDTEKFRAEIKWESLYELLTEIQKLCKKYL
jgi:hypothetical protein